MQRVKRRIFSGVVCEQEVYTVSDRANIKKAEPRPRFKDDEERAQHRIGISKRKHQRLVNENFSPLSLYSTLTFDDDSEVHTFSEARRIRDNYFRRLQRACPDAKIIIYMGRGKSTNRIHFHMISDGIPEETISGKWNDGSVIHIRHLREHNYYNGVDYGQDYTGLADYLFNHWTPEQGGHRWKATRNLRQPEKEAPTLALRTYTEKKAPIAPKGYKLVEARATKWGYIFYGISRESLPERGERKRKYDKVERKKAARAPQGESIEERPQEINDRQTFGHWEGDCVCGKKRTKETLFVLSERLTRNEIIIKMPDQTAASVVAALNKLERRFGKKFSQIFKSITFDNGSEFMDCAGIEKSVYGKDRKRTKVYYCHPYSAYERGTNENINKMIRRFLPKGTDFRKVTAAYIQRVETWINNYPREILGFETSGSLFERYVAEAA